MKKSKWLALAGVALLGVGVLAACSSKSNTSGTTYGYVYSSDPETLDYITSNTGPTKSVVTNGVDGLMAVIDKQKSQPAYKEFLNFLEIEGLENPVDALTDAIKYKEIT